jgi:hypothetical protein
MPRFAADTQPPAQLGSDDRRRQVVRHALVKPLAQLLYQADKGSTSVRLDDLRSDGARDVYYAVALVMLDPESRAGRVRRVHEADADHHTDRRQDEAAIVAQARRDIAQHTPARPPAGAAVGRCFVCGDRLSVTDVCLLRFSDTHHTGIHGSCASADARCEALSTFTFQWRGGAR